MRDACVFLPVVPCSPADHNMVSSVIIYPSINLSAVCLFIHRYPSTHIILPELSVLSSNCVPPVSRMQGEPARFEAQKESAGCEQEFFFHGWNLGCWPGKSDAFPRKSASFRNDSNDFKLGDFKTCKKIKKEETFITWRPPPLTVT